MLNLTPLTSPISNLPNVLILHIASFLGLPDTSNLDITQKILNDKLLKNPQLWKNLILRYFNYLIDLHPKQYEAQSKILFLEEYHRRCARECEDHVTPAEWLDLLAGKNLEAIANISDAQVREKRYILAVSAGHFQVLAHLGENGKGRALDGAAKNGNSAAVNTLLEKAGNTITDDDKCWALHSAVTAGHIVAVNTLLEKAGNAISDHNKGLELWHAAKHCHIGVVNTLLEKAGNAISAYHKGLALRLAVENKHIDVINTLLEKVGNAITDDDKWWALRSAVTAGHVGVVNTLLEKAGNAISDNNKGWLLRQAASHGLIGVVNALLEKAGTAISGDHKGPALRFAVENMHIDVVNTLLEKVGNDISFQDQNTALSLAKKRYQTQIITAFTTYYQSLKAKYLEAVKQRPYHILTIGINDCHIPKEVLTTIIQEYDEVNEDELPQPTLPDAFAITNAEMALARLEGHQLAQSELENQERLHQSKTETGKMILSAFGNLAISQNSSQPLLSSLPNDLTEKWGEVRQLIKQYSQSSSVYLKESMNEILKFVLENQNKFEDASHKTQLLQEINKLSDNVKTQLRPSEKAKIDVILEQIRLRTPGMEEAPSRKQVQLTDL